MGQRRLLYVVNEAHFFLSHRLPMARAALDMGYEVHVAAPPDHVWAPRDFDVRELTALGFHYHSVPISRRGLNVVEDLITLRALLRLFRSLQPELVNTMTIKPVIYGGIAARALKVPALVSLVTGLGHVFVTRNMGSSLLRRLVLEGYRQAFRHRNARVVFQNADDRGVFVRAGIVAEQQTSLIRGSGVALDVFAPSDEPNEPITIVLPARLIWEKGVADFVAAAKILKHRNAKLRFALVGDSRATNPRSVPIWQLEQWVRDGVAEWWGRRDDMPSVFAQSHIVCLPSVYGEGVPKVLIEAAACSRPIITTDIPGCREVVQHGVNGFLIPPGDIEALVGALDTLSHDYDLRRRFGRNGRHIVESEFSTDEVTRKTHRIYAELGRHQ